MSDVAGSIVLQLGQVIGKLEGIEARLERADDSRALMHQEINQLVLRTTHLETDTLSVKAQLTKLQAVSDDVMTLRTKAAGAGALGTWLVRIGIGIVTLAGWVVGAYTYLAAWLSNRP